MFYFWHLLGETQILITELFDADQIASFRKNIGIIFSELISRNYIQNRVTILSCIEHPTSSMVNFYIVNGKVSQISIPSDTILIKQVIRDTIKRKSQLLVVQRTKNGHVISNSGDYNLEYLISHYE